jgi:hypothetical protein
VPLPADLDTLLTALYVEVDDHIIAGRRGPGRPRRLSDAELACLAVAQVLLGFDSEPRWLRFARTRLGHLFPYLPHQPGYHKRLEAAAPLLAAVIDHLARQAPCWHDQLLAHARRNHALRPGLILIGDEGFAGREFEQLVTASFRLSLVRPDRRDEVPRHGSIGWIRQWIESIFDTLEGQLSLEEHGARTDLGVYTRTAQRLQAMAAAIWHNWTIGALARPQAGQARRPGPTRPIS